VRRGNKCYMGHEMTLENTYIGPNGPVCRKCARANWRDYYYRKRYGMKRAPASVKDRDHAQR
jgi:hypothetical protein